MVDKQNPVNTKEYPVWEMIEILSDPHSNLPQGFCNQVAKKLKELQDFKDNTKQLKLVVVK